MSSCPIHAPAMCAGGHPCPDTGAALREIASWPKMVSVYAIVRERKDPSIRPARSAYHHRDQEKLRATRKRYEDRQRAKREAERANQS